ncbi:protein sneaky-like [Leptopilina heterotoma]|uniref:protein sneaky-like n=1 Tax=Leptopilina heterotoma TaxID=63436 RepID=UPI001CA80EA3|nr:protein sneaky-like [Leptopilina heterotoma]
MDELNWIGKGIEYLSKRTSEIYFTKFPTLYHLCYDPIGTHKKSRTFFGFLLGFFMGFSFYEFVIVDFQFDQITSLIFGALIITMLSFGFAISIQARCIGLLTIPAFFGRSGRSVLKALVFGYVIAGPIFNLTLNGKEVVRTFSCTNQLTQNMSKTRYNLMIQPFKQALMSMKTNAEEIKDTLSSVKDLISPIVEEIEGQEEMQRLQEENDYLDELQNDTKRSEEIEQKRLKAQLNAKSEGEIYEANYKAKIETRCEDQLSHGTENCRKMFANAYDKCYIKVSPVAAWLLCWPMKLTFICNIVQALGGPNICNPEGNVDSGIGEGYAQLKETKKVFGENMRKATLQYQVKKPRMPIDVHDAKDTAKAILHEFDSKKKMFDTITTLIKRCLALVFLKIILGAQRYHDEYLTKIEHDNFYITSYFRKIDARRKARGSSTLLPLRKCERQKFVDPYKIKQSKFERKSLVGQTAKLILEIATVTTFVLLDILFYETLDIIKRHFHLEFSQKGHHDMSIEVRGSGLIASLVRSVIRGFNIKKRINTVVSNEECLPRARKLPGYIIFKIYGTYFAIWLMLLATAYTQRMRRVICSFFYRKREKRRVLYLYNESTRKRFGYLRFMKAKVKNLVRTRNLEKDIDLWLGLRKRYPKIFGWLQFFACAREKCLVCEETEPRKEPKFRKCDTPGCPFLHCQECWRDVGEICLACADPYESGSNSEETDNEDDDDDEDDEF